MPPVCATLLSARKIIDALDSSKPNPGKDFFIDKAIKEAAATLEFSTQCNSAAF
jgi:hypothetical protein